MVQPQEATVIKVGPLGRFNNNAYLIIDPQTSEGIIVDMPEEGEKILQAAQGARITKIVLTHTHFDHTLSYDLIRGATGAPVYCHPAEANLPANRIDVRLADGDELILGQLRIKVIHTPGHTAGSCCLLVNNILISGDTLFPGGPGRTSRPEDFQQLIGSIVEKLYVLPDDVVVHPGHGNSTTIGRSKAEYAVFASRPHPPDLCGDVLWESS